MKLLLLPVGLGLLAATALVPTRVQELLLLDAGYHHLGNDETPEWAEAAATPEGVRLDLDFESTANAGEWTLLLEQRSINNPCRVLLDGEPLLTLARGDDLVERVYALPAGSLSAGAHTLTFVSDEPADDIVIGKVRIDPRPRRDVLELELVRLVVTDTQGNPIPARVSFANEAGERPPVEDVDGLVAVRPGVAYVNNGVREVLVRRGRWSAFASRGMEWSVDEQAFQLESSGLELRFSLERQVHTHGFVAADTHIHTLTFSGHGDSSVQERMLTLAGEGVELAISTDHNHNTDYRPYQAELEQNAHFTPIVGNEVSTPVGHFNAFPLDPEDEVPDASLREFPAIVSEIRAHGAQVVILNHPRWPSIADGPFGVARLDPWSGARSTFSEPFSFDAMELVNATDQQDDPLLLFRDWFALLNRGERIVAVGSSDSHTVGVPVGQGRTYVMSSTDNPTMISIDEVCANIAQGRSSIGMGIFCDARVDEDYRMGDLAPVRRGAVDVTVHVRAAAWVEPSALHLFVNGERRDGIEGLATLMEASRRSGQLEQLEFEFRVPIERDSWVVAVVLGEAVEGPFWHPLNDYTLAATNPIWLDADGDGVCSSPRDQARALFASIDGDPARVAELFARCDQAVAVHLLDFTRDALHAGAEAELRSLGTGAAQGRPGVLEWIEGLEPR